MFFYLGYYQSYLLTFVRNGNNNSLRMVNPQTNLCSHRYLLCLMVPPNNEFCSLHSPRNEDRPLP